MRCGRHEGSKLNSCRTTSRCVHNLKHLTRSVHNLKHEVTDHVFDDLFEVREYGGLEIKVGARTGHDRLTHARDGSWYDS